MHRRCGLSHSHSRLVRTRPRHRARACMWSRQAASQNLGVDPIPRSHPVRNPLSGLGTCRFCPRPRPRARPWFLIHWVWPLQHLPAPRPDPPKSSPIFPISPFPRSAPSAPFPPPVPVGLARRDLIIVTRASRAAVCFTHPHPRPL